MKLLGRKQQQISGVSAIYDQDGFYSALEYDLRQAHSEVIIESPFMTLPRIRTLQPTLVRLLKRGVTVVVNTKPIDEQDLDYRPHFTECVGLLQELGVQVLQTVGHHRKLAIIDRQTSWEGSLNILSHRNTCEIMRRIHDPVLTEQLLEFLKIRRFID